MINLNKSKYAKTFISQEELFKLIEPYDIFSYYIPNLKINTTINSPLRKDDNPSFSVFHSNKHNILLFKDLATGNTGNAITFVQRLFPGYSLFEAISQIVIDFGFSNKYICASLEQSSKNGVPAHKLQVNKDYKKEPANLKIKFRTWRNSDLVYWQQYGISLPTLRKFNILPISHYYLYERKKKASTFAYAFVERKDNRMSFKIYQPFADKSMKWRTNHSYSAHQGYLQLPEKGNLLIITKSLKDVMSLYEVTGISAIGVQSETYIIKESVMDEYKQRFCYKVIVLFDNDEAGMNAAYIYRKLFEIPSIIVPKNFSVAKDFSDLVRAKGIKYARNTIYDLVALTFPGWLPF